MAISSFSIVESTSLAADKAVAPRSDLQSVTLVAINDQGELRVRTDSGLELDCNWLESAETALVRLASGDRLLALVDATAPRGLVFGRIGRYRPGTPPDHVSIEAAESLTLKCGDASVELRADGKALVKGDDVLIRAKGTQRIRAGTVSIN
jgi:hypothetical protein